MTSRRACFICFFRNQTAPFRIQSVPVIVTYPYCVSRRRKEKRLEKKKNHLIFFRTELIRIRHGDDAFIAARKNYARTAAHALARTRANRIAKMSRRHDGFGEMLCARVVTRPSVDENKSRVSYARRPGVPTGS